MECKKYVFIQTKKQQQQQLKHKITTNLQRDILKRP